MIHWTQKKRNYGPEATDDMEITDDKDTKADKETTDETDTINICICKLRI